MSNGEGGSQKQGQSQGQSQDQSQRSNRGGSRGGHRRGRGGRGRGHGGASRGGRNATSQPQQEASAPVSVSVVPIAQPEQTPPPAPDSSGASRGGRRNRRGGQRRGGGGRAEGRGGSSAEPQVSFRAGAQRRFGGHLTTSSTNETTTLTAQAPEFVPGQPYTPASSEQPQSSAQPQAPSAGSNSQPRQRRRQRKPKAERQRPTAPKSTKPDMWERIQEDIANFNYECRICTEEVTRKSEVWSCTICWSVVHLQCAQDWFETSQKTTETDGVVWRCPGCNSQVTEEPSAYFCWCKKEINPSQTSTLIPPHSCGQTCSKPRTTCPHPCPLQCHAGPCPTCEVVTPPEPCHCGRHESRLRCKDTDITNGWSCKEICGDLLPCGEHECQEPCHPGVCNPCMVQVKARCYCGKMEKEMPCFDRYEHGDPQDSYSLDSRDWFTGYFDCGNICERAYDCGVHHCQLTCHGQDEEPAHCPFAPDVVLTCPCGKTPLGALLEAPRQTCEDEIPRCVQKCEKKLPCDHTCEASCHTGDCPPCGKMIDTECRCGRTTSKIICFAGEIERPWCLRVCQATKNCGRHRCGEHCCPGEKKAQLRVAQQKKHRRALDYLPVEDEHICTEICGRPLTCGNHVCDRVCHRGPCLSCPEAIWTEISCHCGDTVLEPGQPCGTRPPACNSKCRRQTACGHPAVDHKCHTDDVECPPCPYLTAKQCNCGKETLPWVPCHIQRPHCGVPCGRKLKCGLHTCRKVCHRPEECRDADQGCEQICGKTKINCEHTCSNPCHGNTSCNESNACQAKKVATCPCGNVKKEVKCLASASNPHPDHSLKCNEACERLDRNRRLAEALNINPDTFTTDHVPYSDATLKLYKEMRTLGDNKEREFRVLCNDVEQVRLRYEPMQNRTRQFIHLLAEDFGLKSQSEDYGNDRHVMVWKTTPIVTPPSKTLGQCVEIRAKQAAEASATAALRPPSPLLPGADPFNALVLTNPRFGITIDEIMTNLAVDLATLPGVSFTAAFIHGATADHHDEVLLTATARFSAVLTPLDKALTDLKPRVEASILREQLAAHVLLCHADAATGEITRREVLRQPGGGWSAVASKAARPAAAPVEEKASGRKLVGLRKKKAAPQPGKTWDALQEDVEC